VKEYDAARWMAERASLSRLERAQTLPGPANMGERGPVLAVASDFDPDMVPQVSEEDRAHFLAFLEANAAEVATWPAWKQRAFRLVTDGER
jgi:hypothetical protein